MRTSIKTALWRRVTVTVIATACCWLALSNSTSISAAETQLRWKLQSGETVKYSFQQSSETTTSGAGKATSMTITMSMDLSWLVKGVDAQGTATIEQTVDKLSLSMQVDSSDPITFDSSSRVPASGPAKDIAAAVGPLIGQGCTVKMSSRGEIVSVEPSETLREAWTKTKSGDLLSVDGLSRVLKQASCVFPEQAVEQGAMWEASYESPSPLGKLQLANKYHWAGTESVAGAACEKIEVSSTLTLQPGQTEAAPAKLVESQQSGVLFFDAAAGRFRTSQLRQQLATERQYREKLIRVRTTSTMEMKLATAP